MSCNYSPTYGMSPDFTVQNKNRIAELEQFILQYEKLDPGYGKSSLTQKYLSAKEELELLKEQSTLPIIIQETKSYDFYKLKNFYNENKRIILIISGGLGILLLRKLLK